MKIEWNVIRGRVAEMLPLLKRRIAGYLSAASQIYVGVAKDPWARAAAHRRTGRDFDRMIVLYETNLLGQARSMERKLIEWARATGFRAAVDNLGDGGEGLVGEYERRYVYLLVNGR